MIPVKPVIEADLLIVGGGIGGLMAGIAAGKAGCKNVVIMEKCHARRSGSGATGNDHFNCYIPSYHGDDIEPVFKETMQSLVGQLKEPSLMHKFLEKSFELVQMWDAWGVNMRPTGDWECKGHALPGKPRAFLKYDGSDQKKVLVREAKAVNFGIIYGIGAFSLANDIGVPKYEAERYIKSYLAGYPQVSGYLADTVADAVRDGYVTTLFGRRRYIPELASPKKQLQAFGKRVAMNSPIQGAAADIIKIAMINVDAALKKSGIDARLILQVHDELILEAHRTCAKQAADILKREMENAVRLAVPLSVDIGIGDNWLEC